MKSCLKPKINENVRNVGKRKMTCDEAVKTFVSGLAITYILVDTCGRKFDQLTDEDYITISTILSTAHLTRCSLERRSVVALIDKEFPKGILRLVLLFDLYDVYFSLSLYKIPIKAKKSNVLSA